MAKRHWWKVLVGVMVIGGAGVLFMGVQTYKEAPPLPSFVGPDGEIVISREQILDGQEIFQKYALMEYGSMFGDGGMRGPDFTAEALHRIALAMEDHYTALGRDSETTPAPGQVRESVRERVKRELKENSYSAEKGEAALSEGQAEAFKILKAYYRAKFTAQEAESFKPLNYIGNMAEIDRLSAFFFWGAWVCSARRPGHESSYTHNWPYDEQAGNNLTSESILWSVVGSLSLMLALGIVLFYFGRYQDHRSWQPSRDGEDIATLAAVSDAAPTPTQRATYKFFAVAIVLFLLQVLAGILTVHDFVGFTHFFGHDIAETLPLPVVRSWHVQLSILWIATTWIAGSIFILPRICRQEPPRQKLLVDALFLVLALVVAGTLVGVIAGPKGLLGENWRLLGNQGWEFVELGKLWQGLLFAGLALWAWILVRGIQPVLSQLRPFELPQWMLYVVVGIVALFCSSFVAGPRTNFVIADFWRWMVIHMWAECFFEVFTTVVIAYYMVLMGLIGREAAGRVVYFATILFIGSGFLGISHNFYWNAKPEATLALGSVFSTMQVVPLILLTLEAWKFRHLPEVALRAASSDKQARFGLGEPFLFLVGVNFWNFLGAGVFGFIINLPVINYYEHGTYLTVNHGHAALMGVYGNLSIAAVLFCGRYLIRPERWNGGLLRVSFWSINLGLFLMVLLDLLPAGIYQFNAVLKDGLWSARSQAFIQGDAFQTLTWMRILGGAIFVLGGVMPLTWFVVSRLGALKGRPEVVGVGLPKGGLETAVPSATGD
ncbi:MAG: cbb3-type cytochrome c oxidase subunit I [Planctomycetota bacterium]|nr:cbb3-type cytochrome c oxidase subunit I [Planctomycetota bacterium]